MKHNTIWTGKQSQWVKCLLCEDDYLNSDPQNPHKSRKGSHVSNPSTSAVRWEA